jgi:hypothetical protein
MSKKIKLLLGTNLFGDSNRQHIARESWMYLQRKYPTIIELVAIQFAHEAPVYSPTEFIGYQDYKIPAVFTLHKSSKTEVKDSTKDIPFIKNILNEIYVKANTDETITHFAYINSDCILTDNFIQYLASTTVDALSISRLDIQSMNSFAELSSKGVTVLRNEIAGFDCFVFSKEWWNNHSDKFKDMLIGQPLFDVYYTGLMMLFGGTIYNNSSKPLVCHMFHENTSHNDTVEKQYNASLIEHSMFEKLIVNMMHYHLQYNLCKREPWGRFLTPADGEAEFTRNFFETMRLDTENQVKYIR